MTIPYWEASQRALLTPRFLRAWRSPTRRQPIFLMGCGMYMVMAFGRVLLFMCVLELTICWDMMVYAIMVPIWFGWLCYLPFKALYDRRKQRIANATS